MRSGWLLITATCVTGCATRPPIASVTSNERPAEPVVRTAAAMRDVETRYEVRSYRDPDNPSVRHEAHAVYRTTRVPAKVEKLVTIPRSGVASVSFVPLAPSAELDAELAAQKQITAELRAIHASMGAVEQQAKGQYEVLVNQTADALRLSRQLEDERSRVKELESRLRDRSAVSATQPALAPAPVATEPKW